MAKIRLEDDELFNKFEETTLELLKAAVEITKEKLHNKYYGKGPLLDKTIDELYSYMEMHTGDMSYSEFSTIRKLYTVDYTIESNTLSSFMKIKLSNIVSNVCNLYVVSTLQIAPVVFIQEICSNLIHDINSLDDSQFRFIE